MSRENEAEQGSEVEMRRLTLETAILGPKIDALKDRKGWSWREVARAIGDDNTAVGVWAKGAATLERMRRLNPKLRALLEEEQGEQGGNGSNPGSSKKEATDDKEKAKERKKQPMHGRSSNYRGVSWSKSDRKWLARIYYSNKNHNLGLFEEQDDAARAYDRAAKGRSGKNTQLNFPEEDEQGVEESFLEVEGGDEEEEAEKCNAGEEDMQNLTHEAAALRPKVQALKEKMGWGWKELADSIHDNPTAVRRWLQGQAWKVVMQRLAPKLRVLLATGGGTAAESSKSSNKCEDCGRQFKTVQAFCGHRKSCKPGQVKGSGSDSAALGGAGRGAENPTRTSHRTSGTTSILTGAGKGGSSGIGGNGDDSNKVVSTPASAAQSSSSSSSGGGGGGGGESESGGGGSTPINSATASAAAFDRLGSELNCPICRDLLDDPHSLPCNHGFCGDCIRMALSKALACPMCKTPCIPRSLTRNPLLANVVAQVKALQALTAGAPSLLSSPTAVGNAKADDGERSGSSSSSSSGGGGGGGGGGSSSSSSSAAAQLELDIQQAMRTHDRERLRALIKQRDAGTGPVASNHTPHDTQPTMRKVGAKAVSDRKSSEGDVAPEVLLAMGRTFEGGLVCT
jgi:hypothetical protein